MVEVKDLNIPVPFDIIVDYNELSMNRDKMC